MSLTFHSPAKVNLFLRVSGKRTDGYHEIASLFQTIDLFDTLHISLSDEDSLTGSGIPVPCDPSNLIHQAANLFRQKTGKRFHIAAHLEKKIPIQAGLGGGSSNAATTLWSLNQLMGCPASVQQLQEWSSELGSDVPFFFSSGTAYCTGRGEKVETLDPLPPFSLSLKKPDRGLSTPEVYRALNLKALPRWEPRSVLNDWMNGSPHFCNDLESAAFHIDPTLSDYQSQLLTSGYTQAAMTGSGTTFICLGKHPTHMACNRSLDSWYLCRDANRINLS